MLFNVFALNQLDVLIVDMYVVLKQPFQCDMALIKVWQHATNLHWLISK